MKKLTLKNGFKRLADAELVSKGYTILSAMEDNESFPSPSPTLAELSATYEAYSVATIKAMNKGLQDIMVKNQLKDVLVGQLHQLGSYVLYCAAGNAAVAMSSGFTVSQPRSSSPPITVPKELVLTNGINRGELLLKLKRVPNVLSYRYEITEHPHTKESQWQSFSSTVSKHLFKGLVSGKEYCCRVVAIGIKNQAVYSPVVSRIAL